MRAQLRCEALGFADPEIDAELIALSARVWRKLGIGSVTLEMNSLGTPESRAGYKHALVEYFGKHKQLLDEDFVVSKAEKIDYLNKSINYFKENESLVEEEFAKIVFEDEEITFRELNRRAEAVAHGPATAFERIIAQGRKVRSSFWNAPNLRAAATKLEQKSAYRAIVDDVAYNAVAAGTRDPRGRGHGAGRPAGALAPVGPEAKSDRLDCRRLAQLSDQARETVRSSVVTAWAALEATREQIVASQAQISAFGPVNNNAYSDTNRTEVRSYRVSPFIVHQFGGFATTQLRYTHDLVDSDLGGFGRSTSDVIDLSLDSGPTFKTLGWGLQLNRENLEDGIAPKSINSSALASLRYSLSRQFSLTATGGYDRFDYEGMGEGTKGASWSLGFGYEPSARTSVRMSAGRRLR